MEDKLKHIDVLHILGACVLNAIKTADPETFSEPKNEELFYKGVMSGIAGIMSQTGLMEEMKKCDKCDGNCMACNTRQANLYKTAYAYLTLSEEERDIITKEANQESEKIKYKLRKESEDEEIKNTILKTGKFL